MTDREDDPVEADAETGGDADEEPPGSTDDAPLADLAREVRERRAAEDSEADAAADPELDDDPFESVDVGDVDDEAVWESFVSGEMDPAEGVGLGADVREASDEDHVVSKREFCQQCPHLSDPPASTCTHEGTTIVEVIDADHFRVRNCPIVVERRGSSID